MSARDARLAIVGSYQAFEAAANLPRLAAMQLYCQHYNVGASSVADWVRKIVPSLVHPTLYRWLRMVATGNVDSLADRRGRRQNSGILTLANDGAVAAKMLTLIAHQPHLSSDHVRTLIKDIFGDTLEVEGVSVPMPSGRIFRKELANLRVKHKAELLALHNPDAFKSRMRVSGSNVQLTTRLNELWQIDASPADVLCKDGRYTIYVCIDVFSRRIVASVSRTARADSVGQLLKKAMLAFGVPETIKTDNGSDFVARSTKRLLAALQIETITSAPFSPEQKGVVERAIGTLQRDIMPLLPGFIGHSVADRKAIENRKAFSKRLGQDDARAFTVDLTMADFSEYLDRMIDERYHHRAHGGLGKATPFQVAASWSRPIRRIENEAALAVLLAPVAGKDGLRLVGKRGLRINGSDYIASGLMPGDQVFVRMDETDMGRIYVFETDGETFRTMAVCPELAGVDPAAAVAAAQAAQKEFLAERVAPLRREAAKIKPRDMIEGVLRQAQKEAGTLVAFPRKSDTHTTPALQGAKDAHEALEIMSGKREAKRRPLSAAEQAMQAKIAAQMAEDVASAETKLSAEPVSLPVANLPVTTLPVASVRKLRVAETPQQRFAKAKQFEQRINAGQEIATEDAVWLGGYQQSAEYRGLAKFHESFAETSEGAGK